MASMDHFRRPKKGSAKRASTPRSRNGCATCRQVTRCTVTSQKDYNVDLFTSQRRIKCDETKPYCANCEKLGWKCDGYGPSGSAKSADETARLAFVAASSKDVIRKYSLPFRIPGGKAQRRLFHYYCNEGKYQMWGFLNEQFWSDSVLQLSRSESAIRHAIVALSSLHLNHPTQSFGFMEADKESLNHYGTALASLRKRVTMRDTLAPRVALTCCILFCCFESTLGNYAGCISHLDNGLQLVRSANKFIRDTRCEVDVQLSRMLQQLELQDALCTNKRLPCMELDSIMQLSNQSTESFSSVLDAHDELISSMRRTIHLLNGNAMLQSCNIESIPLSVVGEKQSIGKDLELWKLKLEQFQATQKSWKNDDQTSQDLAVRVLMVRFLMMKMLLNANLPLNDAVFSPIPNVPAAEILDKIQEIVRRSEQESSTMTEKHTKRQDVLVQTGLISYAMRLAVNCIDPDIRKSATRILFGLNCNYELHRPSY